MAAIHRRTAQHPLTSSWASAAAAAVTVAAVVPLASATTAPAGANWPFRPTALVTPANSTAQIFASSDYYGVDWIGRYGQPQVVPFFLGPQGIVTAVDRNRADQGGVAVLSSGWGAGQASTALGLMHDADDPALQNVRLMVLDNNTNRAGGGFWTSYPTLAPLLLTSAQPTPDDTPVPVVDTAYEYNINSDAPTYPLNVVADANSLMAYLYDYGGQAGAPMPPEALQPPAPGAQHYHYVVAPDGSIAETIPVDGNITYVTFRSDGLPLLRPLRSVPGGNVVADALEPAATALVNAGYQDGAPIPRDPGVTRPAALMPPPSVNTAAVNQLAPPRSPATAVSDVGDAGVPPSVNRDQRHTAQRQHHADRLPSADPLAQHDDRQQHREGRIQRHQNAGQ